MSAGDLALDVRVAHRNELAVGITEFVLAATDGGTLPPYRAGAHIDVMTPAGHRRSYSLCGESSLAPEHYTIAVDRHDDGEGGSLSMHRQIAAGSALRISQPSPGFPRRATGEAVLIAGGVGITAVRGLFRELLAADEPVRLLYLARHRERAAYLEELRRLGAQVHISAENTGGRYDLWPLLAEPGDRELYCCGPASLMRAVKALTMHWRPSFLHFEDFRGVSAIDPFAVPFTAVWEPTGQRIKVDASETLLDRLEQAGIDVPSSCRSGTCGTCRVSLVAGAPQHRDAVLTDEERATQLISCVSRAEGTVHLRR